MKEITSKECVVVFLDVLGYKDWVKNAESGDYFYNAFRESLENIEKIKSQFVQAQYDFNCIDITIWSDSLIFIVDLSEANPDKISVVSRFFYFLAMFINEFLAKTGYFLRGGITYGDFLQKKILGEENRFIFSKAYIVAVELEKKAHNPRILIDAEFVKIAKAEKLFDQVINSAVREDIYNQHYFDHYFYFEYIFNLQRPYPENQLKLIKCKLLERFAEVLKKKNVEVENKYKYFFHYHNVHVSSIFQAQLTEKDFENLGIKKVDILIPLLHQGIVDDDGDFFIKQDIPADAGKILSRLNCEKFDGKALQLANIIKERIEESSQKIKECSIVV